jgi:hypothetical protein
VTTSGDDVQIAIDQAPGSPARCGFSR